MLSLRDAVRQLRADVRSQKMRTALTVLGLVWGTVAVTLLLAFGEGLHRKLIRDTAGMGDRIAIAWPGLTSMTHEGLGKGRRIRLTEDDVAAVARDLPGLTSISGEYQKTLKLRHASKALAVTVCGVAPQFGEMRNLIPQAGGRFLDPLDEAQQRRVVFLGNKVADDLLGGGGGTDAADRGGDRGDGGKGGAVGTTIDLHGSPFLVVGVLVAKEQDSNYSGPDAQMAWIPASTFRALTGEKYLDNFVFQAAGAGETGAVTTRLQQALGHRLRFNPEDKEALSVWDTTEQFAFLDRFFLAFRAFLGIVGSLTLVVGGIGVSNIMNVVVEERTREIGVKMALGARPGYILRQLLLETALVTAIGGAIGFAVAIGICAALPAIGLAEHIGSPRVSPLVALSTIAVLGVVGFLAGYFPARDAARMDPVVAMKL